MARTSSSFIAAIVISIAASSIAVAQPAGPVPVMVSRSHKQHNRNWYAKAPPVPPPPRQKPLTSCGSCTYGCCGNSCCPRPPNPCFSCPEECCVGSCDCGFVGSMGCFECPDSCCGTTCCPPPAPPPACAGCDADHCCHDACQAERCSAADAPGQCDVDQTACENGCCPHDHPYCCGGGATPFCGASPSCGGLGDGGTPLVDPRSHGCELAARGRSPSWPAWPAWIVAALLLALALRRRFRRAS